MIFEAHDTFGIEFPTHCPEVPTEILNPRNTWADKDAYDQKAAYLANAFNKNFEKFAEFANEEIMNGAPKIKEHA